MSDPQMIKEIMAAVTIPVRTHPPHVNPLVGNPRPAKVSALG